MGMIKFILLEKYVQSLTLLVKVYGWREGNVLGPARTLDVGREGEHTDTSSHVLLALSPGPTFPWRSGNEANALLVPPILLGAVYSRLASFNHS